MCMHNKIYEIELGCFKCKAVEQTVQISIKIKKIQNEYKGYKPKFKHLVP